MSKEDKKEDGQNKALALARSLIVQSQGKDAITAIDPANIPKVDVIPTGSIGLDRALGIGGIPRGRITEIYGAPSNGKTTIALHCIAEAQKLGLHCLFVDVEHAIDLSYAQDLGVNLSDDMFTFMQPVSGEDALKAMDTFAKSGAAGLMVLDSVDALLTKAEIEGEVGDNHMGQKARLMGDICRKLPANCSQSNTASLFINQTRMKIGVVYGDPTTTSGGNALKFYTSVRLQVNNPAKIKDGAVLVGNETVVKVVKNKLGIPFKEARFEIEFGIGIAKEKELLDIAADVGVIEKSGAWYSYNGQRLGQGRANSADFLVAHPEILEEIKGRVLGD